MKLPRFLPTFLLALVTALTLFSTVAPGFETENRAIESLGPAPRDADGRFTNWTGTSSHGGLGVRFPFFLRRIGGIFRSRPGFPTRVENDGAFLRENSLHSTPTVTWVGHATLLIQMDHVTFLTDPIWSDSPSPISFAGPRRYVEPGIAIEDLPKIDFVVISHNHYDHLDLPTLRTLAERNPETRFLVPLGNADLLKKNKIDRVEEFDWGESTTLGDITIHCLPSRHWSKRSLRDDRKALWSSWAVQSPKRKFYFSGDTGYFKGFSRIGEAMGPFDLVAVPIGAYEPTEMMKESHMNPEEAVRAAIDLGAKRAIAIHFGTFDLSDEPVAEPPARFLAAAEDSGLTLDASWVFQIGETRPF
ncbi:MAG: MBL fold metallo-hydrolase [Myxococcales bacterium]|nr:MBL fold metallo-hydrolase [Myxococcales bacterium]HIK86074.1 MBL fold metallo-hydrolase [Myxococcales bacterium]